MSPQLPAEVKRYKAASKVFRREIKADPAKARAFLIRAGIAEPSPSHP